MNTFKTVLTSRKIVSLLVHLWLPLLTCCMSYTASHVFVVDLLFMCPGQIGALWIIWPYRVIVKEILNVKTQYLQNTILYSYRYSSCTVLIFSPMEWIFNPLNPELNPICYLLALLGAHHFLHVSRIRVKLLTFRLLMSYIYGAPILDVSKSHTTTQHSR